jgi:hypothetical protein
MDSPVARAGARASRSSEAVRYPSPLSSKVLGGVLVGVLGEFGCSGITCWRRLRDWCKDGVFERLHRRLLDRLGRVGLVDWSRASLDSANTQAKRGARRPAPLH